MTMDSAGIRLAIPTRDRPELLRAALDSYTANATRHGRSFETVIVDDGDETGSHERQAAVRMPQTTTVLSARDRRRFARNAARYLDIEERLILFGLLGRPGARTTGAARNAAILATVGHPFVCIDDDTVCDLWQPATLDSTVTVVRSNPQTVWFSRIDEMPPIFTAADLDFFREHARVLGSTPRELGVSSGAGSSLDMLLDRPVVATLAGTYGKPGMETAPHLLLDDESFARIASDEDAYSAARQSTSLARKAPRLVSHGKVVHSSSREEEPMDHASVGCSRCLLLGARLVPARIALEIRGELLLALGAQPGRLD